MLQLLLLIVFKRSELLHRRMYLMIQCLVLRVTVDSSEHWSRCGGFGMTRRVKLPGVFSGVGEINFRHG